MKYTKQMSSAEPGLILIMLDRSGSMTESYGQKGGGKSKAEFASMAVNRVIYNIVMSNQNGTSVKNRCFIAVIGYGAQVDMVQAGMLQDIANNPLRTEKLMKSESDGAGGVIQIPFEMPIWVDPIARAMTPMGEAFSQANKAISGWIKKCPNNAAPIVINITDGMPTDSARAITEAQQLMSLGTSDGNVLLFNAHISDGALAEDLFPNSASSLQNPEAEFLYNISSEIPSTMFPAAQGSGFNPQPGARGMVFNAEADTLVNLLSFGSSGATGERYS